jgi:hypothetical protein
MKYCFVFLISIFCKNLTAEELDMSNEEIETESKKEAANIDRYASPKQKIEHWLNLINHKDEQVYIEQIFKDLPWVQERYNL